MRVEQTAEREAEADAHQIEEDDVETGNPVVIFRPASCKWSYPDPYIQADKHHSACHQSFRSAESFVNGRIRCLVEQQDGCQRQIDDAGYGYKFYKVMF